MRRILLWCLSTLSVVVLLFGYSTSTSGPLATSAPTAIISGTAASSTTTSSDGGSSSSGQSSTKSSTSTVTGSVVSTRWGPVEVQVSLDGTTISGVQVLQYPNGNSRDAEINGSALPILIQETLDAQNANIDMVSGATYTSVGYQQSLQSALDQGGT